MRCALGLLSVIFLTCSCSRCGGGPGVAAEEPGASGAGSPPPPVEVPTSASLVSAPSFASLPSPKVQSAAMVYREPAGPAEPPVSLTAPDGTGLGLVSLEGKAVLEGPLAFTELHLVFENPTERQIEGRFSITLPEQAALSRFAMKIDGAWQEAEVVEKQAARRAYEDILHRGQDPALLEKEAGNQFRARIFPIPARAKKEIKLSYSQELAGADEAYRLPLAGWPRMERLEVEVRRGADVRRLSRADFEPKRDFEVAQEGGLRGLRSGRLAVARVAPDIEAGEVEMDDLLVLVDTSASRALGFPASVERLGVVLRALEERHGADMKLRIAAFDQGVEPIFEGTAGELGADVLERLLKRRPLGASNLQGALAWAAERAPAERILVVTDGVPTAGATGGEALRDAARALRSGTQRLDVLLAGGIRDRELMERLARGVLARDGVVVDASRPAAAIAERLGRATVSGVSVAVPGARWSWPAELDGIQPGDEVLVFAALEERPRDKLAVKLGGSIEQAHEVPLAEAARPVLERAAARARIRRLEATGDPELREEIVRLSVEHRVLSEHTALLVLETEEDYVRFGIDRDSLSDILVIDQDGVEIRSRPKLILPREAAAPPARARGDGEPKKGREAFSGAGAAEGGGDFDDDRGGDVHAGVLGTLEARRPAPLPETLADRSGPGAAADREAPMDESAEAEADEEPPAFRQIAEGGGREQAGEPAEAEPWSGRFAAVMSALEAGIVEPALLQALAWRVEEPGDVMALIALGEALEAAGKPALAARAYGSIIDLYPSRADMRRFAGERLERLGREAASLAVDTYEKARAQRPDHPSSHRLYAWALLRAGEVDEAFSVMEEGLSRRYPASRFRGVQRIMREDLGLIAAAWIAAEPERREKVQAALAEHGVELPTRPSTRFVMSWETDANDVDLHVYDGRGGHGWYQAKSLASGGALYADVTTGYGPEAFVIPGEPGAGPYHLQAHYYSRGPMGYGMGTLDVIVHDGNGGLAFEHHPFVIMKDRAYVDLVRGWRPAKK